jgi:hypothetical protein
MENWEEINKIFSYSDLSNPLNTINDNFRCAKNLVCISSPISMQNAFLASREIPCYINVHVISAVLMVCPRKFVAHIRSICHLKRFVYAHQCFGGCYPSAFCAVHKARSGLVLAPAADRFYVFNVVVVAATWGSYLPLASQERFERGYTGGNDADV